MITKIIALILLTIISIVSCSYNHGNDKEEPSFNTYSRYRTTDLKFYFEFYNNLEFGTGKAKIGDEYEPVTFKLTNTDDNKSFLLHFDDLGCEITLAFSRYSLGFVSGKELLLLDASWAQWSSYYSKTEFENIDYDAKHYYGSTFENPYYGLEMDYTFKDFNTFDMEGAGEYEGLSFSFLPGKRFKIDYDGKESTGAYETTVKTLYLCFEENNLINDLGNIRIPMYIRNY